MAADFLRQTLPQGNTPALGANGVMGNVWYRFLDALFKRCGSGGSSDIVFGAAELPTTATKGFFFCPTCAGVPTGVPEQDYGDQTALVYDSAGNRLYAYPPGGPWTLV